MSSSTQNSLCSCRSSYQCYDDDIIAQTRVFVKDGFEMRGGQRVVDFLGNRLTVGRGCGIIYEKANECRGKRNDYVKKGTEREHP